MRKNERGAILILSLVTLAVMLFLGLGVINTTGRQSTMVNRLYDQSLAEQAADFAIANAKYHMTNDMNNQTTTSPVRKSLGLDFQNQPCPSNFYTNETCISNNTCSGSNFFYAAGNCCYDSSDNATGQFDGMFLNTNTAGITPAPIAFPISGMAGTSKHLIQTICSNPGSVNVLNPSVRMLITGQAYGRMPETFVSKKEVFYYNVFRRLNDNQAPAVPLTGTNVVNVTLSHNAPINIFDPCYNMFIPTSRTVKMTPMSQYLMYHGQCRNSSGNPIQTTMPKWSDSANAGCGPGAGYVVNVFCRMDASGNVQVIGVAPDAGKTSTAGGCYTQYGVWKPPGQASTLTLFSTVNNTTYTFNCTAAAAPPYQIHKCTNSP